MHKPRGEGGVEEVYGSSVTSLRGTARSPPMEVHHLRTVLGTMVEEEPVEGLPCTSDRMIRFHISGNAVHCIIIRGAYHLY